MEVPRAPTREVLSLRAYSALGQLNTLRRDSCALWQSPEVATIASLVEKKVELQELRMRDDILKDVGAKKKALTLLLNYNPLWLRVGLETIFGEVIHGGQSIVVIASWMVQRVLSNPDILRRFAHKTGDQQFKLMLLIFFFRMVRLRKFFNGKNNTY